MSTTRRRMWRMETQRTKENRKKVGWKCVMCICCVERNKELLYKILVRVWPTRKRNRVHRWHVVCLRLCVCTFRLYAIFDHQQTIRRFSYTRIIVLCSCFLCVCRGRRVFGWSPVSCTSLPAAAGLWKHTAHNFAMNIFSIFECVFVWCGIGTPHRNAQTRRDPLVRFSTHSIITHNQAT